MTLLAMHMSNELLSLPVAGVTLVLAAIVVTVAGMRAGKVLGAEKLPLMGVLGAFVFAGQMINFTLPGMPGTSGHLGGGVLLAIVMGPAAGIVTMAAILIIQCLLFQDGGLLALGCNIINMGVLPCLAGCGVYRLLLGAVDRAKPWRQYLAAWLGCMIGITAGAAMVPLQASVSNVLQVPVTSFLAVMVGVHLSIGFVEGLITFTVVAYLRRVRPAVLALADPDGETSRLSRKALVATLLVTAMLLAGVISWFASGNPDGLEWSYMEHDYAQSENAVSEPTGVMAAVGDWQSRWSPMSDYTKRPAPLGQAPAEQGPGEENAEAPWPAVDGWGSLAGVLGTASTLLIVYLVAVLLRRTGRMARSD